MILTTFSNNQNIGFGFECRILAYFLLYLEWEAFCALKPFFSPPGSRCALPNASEASLVAYSLAQIKFDIILIVCLDSAQLLNIQIKSRGVRKRFSILLSFISHAASNLELGLSCSNFMPLD